MGQPFIEWKPELFPVDSLYMVAPFWNDIDIREMGDTSYQVYSTGSPLLDTVNTNIRDEENISFIGHWMLVAEWNNVPEYEVSPSTSQVGFCDTFV